MVRRSFAERVSRNRPSVGKWRSVSAYLVDVRGVIQFWAVAFHLADKLQLTGQPYPHR